MSGYYIHLAIRCLGLNVVITVLIIGAVRCPTQHLLIAGAGALLGIAGGLGANLWLAGHLAMARMSPTYIVIEPLIVLSLSQLAVLWPAMRAASISPATATRGL